MRKKMIAVVLTLVCLMGILAIPASSSSNSSKDLTLKVASKMGGGGTYSICARTKTTYWHNHPITDTYWYYYCGTCNKSGRDWYFEWDAELDYQAHALFNH